MNFQPWLISISRNLCIDYYRSVRKERQTLDRGVDPVDLSPVSPDPGPLITLERRVRRERLYQAMDALTPILREAVVLRGIQELSY